MSFTMQQFSKKCLATLIRFPLAIASSFALTAFALNETVDRSSFSLEETILILAFGAIWFVALELCVEGQKLNRYIVYLVGTAIYAGLALYLYVQDFGVGVQLAVAGVFLVTIAPFLRRVDWHSMWKFNYGLVSGILFATLIAGLLGAGLLLVLVSADYLFDLKIEMNYLRLFIIVAGFVWPTLSMMHIPPVTSLDDIKNERLRLVTDFILAPIWMALALIINGYALRIAVLQTLPRGKVSMLVALLGIVGFATYCLGANGEEESKSRRVFSRCFGVLMIAPLVLMGIGTSRRILEYGVTQWRYLNVVLFIALCAAVVHYFLRPHEKFFRFAIASVALLLAITTIGPWSVQAMSANSQFNRLKDTLTRRHVLIDGHLASDEVRLPVQELVQIRSMLAVLVRYNKVALLEGWFAPEQRQHLANASADTMLNLLQVRAD